MSFLGVVKNIYALNSLRNRYSKVDCIIVGNGPSVEVNDLKLIQNSDKVIFTFNRFYLAYKQLEIDFFQPSFIMSIDPQMIRDFGQEIIYNKKNSTVLFGTNNKNTLKGNFITFNIKNRIPFKFQRNPFKRVSTGDSSVVAAIQLAFFMGIRNIYLYGIDHNFEHEEKNSNGMVSGGDNHFIKNYRDGKEWHPPVSLNIEKAFEKCDEFLRENNGYLINCSRKTKLKNIERRSIDDCL
jgi:hypothetical protein